jgi:hypothetical protein
VADVVALADGELPDLGALLALLDRAEAPFESVVVTYRQWVHSERSSVAFRAQMELDKRRGMAVGTVQAHSRRRAQPPREREEREVEREEIVRLWRQGDRVREEFDGRGGRYGVRDGDLWWSWDAANGARSNEDDPSVRSGIGDEFAIMLDPWRLLGVLRFEVTGRAVIAGRRAITVKAVPRLTRMAGPRGPWFQLNSLGNGADRFELGVDEQLGVLLSVVAFRDDEPFRELTTVSVAFDEPIPDERFRFEPPPGESIRSIRERPHPRHVTVVEAQQLAPFTVLIPERIPATWHPHCDYLEARERPPNPARVSLHYRSDDGHESVHITQLAAADRATYDELTRGEGWQDATRDGTVVRVIKPGSAGGQTQAHLERDGTFVFLMSETLNGDQLATIAAGLKPAPNTGSI